MRYCDKFKKEDFDEYTLEKAKELGEIMLNNKIIDVKTSVFMFLKQYLDHYNLGQYKIQFSKDHMFGGGVVMRKIKTVKFYGEPSFITVLHELRHIMQDKIDEEDARAWSCSLFYILFPDEYEELKQNSKLLYY